jgi:outer membrane biosynthesis protein TonB
MMDQLREEKNATRKQQLANLLQGAGVDTATINSISQVKTSGVSGQHFGEGSGREQCVALSKHFAPQIGPASKWQFNEGTAGIVPGAVIATRRYADGSGGKMASQMPDGKSHYHTGIALTRPDASGNVLIFDQAKSYGSKITKVNINDYHGETWGVVKGGEPTSRSMEAVNIALSRANESEKAAITESMRGSAPKAATSTGQLEASVDVGPVPTRPMNQEGQPLPPQQQAPIQQPGAPQEPAPQVKADAPPPAPQPKTVTFRLNKGKYLDQIEGKYGSLLNAPIVGPGREGAWQQTLDGINEKGVKFKQTKDGIEITLPESDTRISEVRAEMKNRGLDEKTFLQSQINEPKVETKKAEVPTPPPEKKVETPAPQAPQTPAPTPPAQAPAPTPTPEPPKVEAKPQEPPKVPGASDGGLFDVGDRNVAISPMDKRDDKAVIDTKTQQPLFTVKSGESINVTPQQKVDGIAPAQDNIRNEINALRQEMGSSFADAGGRMSPVQMTQIRSAGTDNPNFVNNLTKQNVDMWNNPVMERAMNRTRLQETGDPLNNHFSYGNTNG